MSYKDLFNKFFGYMPTQQYQFNLPDTETVQASKSFNEDILNETNLEDNNNNNKDKNKNKSKNEKVDIYPSLTVNEEYVKTKYNLLINSDIVLRNFTINARGKQYNAFLLYIDGMVDSQIMDDFVLKPLMLRNKSNSFEGSQNKVISEAVTNNITVRKVKKFDLPSYLLGCLMPQNSVTQETSFEDVISGINSRKLWVVC